MLWIKVERQTCPPLFSYLIFKIGANEKVYG